MQIAPNSKFNALQKCDHFFFLLSNVARRRIKARRTREERAGKKSREAVSSAVSSDVRVNFGEIFASRGCETNIYRV